MKEDPVLPTPRRLGAVPWTGPYQATGGHAMYLLEHDLAQSRMREDQASAEAASVEEDGALYQSFIEEHRPQLRFHYRAIDHLLEQLLKEEASWDAFFEHSGIEPVLVLYENFAADYETSTLHLLERLGISCPDGFEFEPRMKKQSDRINDDWTKRYCDLRLGRDFDLEPVPVEEKAN